MSRIFQKSVSGRTPSGRAFHSNALFWQPASLLIANRRGQPAAFPLQSLALLGNSPELDKTFGLGDGNLDETAS
ncbi:MAG: hypothetical protein B6D68_00255 [spirochete symbiont of Stewartia floridana]|nr:MAG: hypothetical protein B6D68_00255 [spirochete symbiont of Stewartia floridana]